MRNLHLKHHEGERLRARIGIATLRREEKRKRIYLSYGKIVKEKKFIYRKERGREKKTGSNFLEGGSTFFGKKRKRKSEL